MEAFNDLLQYPPLACCVVVESRFSTRTELTKTLRSAQLFDSILEPPSLTDALAELAKGEVDAVIVGNSVTPVRAAEFLREAVRVGKSSNCAFIALASDADDSNEVLKPGELCHRVLPWPSSRRDLADGVVSAVVAANREGTWARVQKSGPSAKPVGATPASSLQSIFAGNITDLDDIVRAVRDGELGLGSHRGPTAVAKARLDAVVSGVFGETLKGEKIARFRTYFANALELWFIDLCTNGEEKARNTLRQSLFSFVESLQ